MKSKNKKNNRLYLIINISIFISILCTIALTAINYFNNLYLNEEMVNRAKTLIRSIEITREWNSSSGGVYIEKTSDVKSNPYIKNPDIQSVSGKNYTLKNSSMMTIEMSHLTGKGELFSYKMRSLNPINPANTPDNFENEALKLFDTGTKEYQKKIKSEEKTFFRYMVPLYVKEDCMACHSKQGYKIGDIRGGISVTLDITSSDKRTNLTKYSAIIFGLISLFFIAAVLLISIWYLKMDLDNSKKTIQILNITDDLTGLFNRTYFLKKINEEFERARRYKYPLSLILANIDSFKTYNDQFGIKVGDQILKSVACIIKPICRESDTVARYGETEFAIILPNTGDKGAVILAEKLRSNVEEYKDRKSTEHVTISLGISTMSADSAYSAETLIYDADTALYRSNESGTNRAVLYTPI